jgi:ABC-type amino acid transport substrate-binding protein
MDNYMLGDLIGYRVRVKKGDYYILKIFHLYSIDDIEKFKKYLKNLEVVSYNKYESLFDEWYDVLVK